MEKVDYKTLKLELEAGVAIITMNRPKAMNAMDTEMRKELLFALNAVNIDPEVKVILLTGSGNVFCVGADLQDGISNDVLKHTEQVTRDEFNPLITSIVDAKKPVMAVINGAAAGAGASLALACDLIVMSENAYIYQAFTQIGLIPDCGMTWHLSRRLGYYKTFEVIADPKPMKAEECLQLNLANKIFPESELFSQSLGWAKQIATAPPLALKYAKKVLRDGLSQNLEDVISIEAEFQGQIAKSNDVKNAIHGFFEKRKPFFTGH